jgi:hypothetical protein
VASGQLQGVEFFGYQIFVFPRFLDLGVPDRMAVGGVFVDAGEAGREGKRFLLNRNANLHESFWIGMFRIGWLLVGDVRG